jgi:mycothiol synthase
MAAYCGRSIGTYLLRQAEVRARELMTNAPPDARVVLYTWVDGGNQVAPHLVEQEGFTLLRYFLWMEIEMDAPPPVPTWPSGITVRTFSPGKDDHAVFDATEDAFQDEPGYEPGNFAEWAYWLFTRDNFDPSLCFLAVDGNEIAGTALCRHDVGDNGGTGWISDVGVRPRWRKKGLGLALLHHVFGEFYRRGVRRCSLSVDVQNLSGRVTSLWRRFRLLLPAQFPVETVMQVRAGIVVSLSFIATDGTAEELSPTLSLSASGAI